MGMSVNYIVLILIWVLGILSYILFVPQNRRRRFLFAFLLCQMFTWFSSLVHVKFHLLSFPVREFPKATEMLLTTAFFLYPLLCGFYIIFEPPRSFMIRAGYLTIWCLIVVILDVAFVKFTNLVVYAHYAWYFTWLNTFCIAVIVNVTTRWFFKSKELLRRGQESV